MQLSLNFVTNTCSSVPTVIELHIYQWKKYVRNRRELDHVMEWRGARGHIRTRPIKAYLLGICMPPGRLISIYTHPPYHRPNSIQRYPPTTLSVTKSGPFYLLAFHFFIFMHIIIYLSSFFFPDFLFVSSTWHKISKYMFQHIFSKPQPQPKWKLYITWLSINILKKFSFLKLNLP